MTLPWLIHRLTYRRRPREHHVRGYKSEGTIITPFYMTVRRLDRFSTLVMDTIDRPAETATRAPTEAQLKDKLIEHKKRYIDKNGRTCRRSELAVGCAPTPANGREARLLRDGPTPRRFTEPADCRRAKTDMFVLMEGAAPSAPSDI